MEEESSEEEKREMNQSNRAPEGTTRLYELTKEEPKNKGDYVKTDESIDIADYMAQLKSLSKK